MERIYEVRERKGKALILSNVCQEIGVPRHYTKIGSQEKHWLKALRFLNIDSPLDEEFNAYQKALIDKSINQKTLMELAGISTNYRQVFSRAWNNNYVKILEHLNKESYEQERINRTI